MPQELKTAVPISLKEAKAWVTNYVTDQTGTNFIRAFLVSIEDLTAIAAEKNKEGDAPNFVRFYLASDVPKGTTEDLHLILMAAYSADGEPKNAKDFIQKDGADGDAGEDPLYDFTNPCPHTCDEGSALYITG
jgi:hypothetical protein